MLNQIEAELGPYQKDPNPAKAGLATRIKTGVHTWKKLYGDFPLPEQAQSRKTRAVESKLVLSQTLEWLVSRQVNRFIELGFHSEVAQTEEEYRRYLALPEGLTQPEAYKGRFDIPLVVEPRLSLTTTHCIAGITEYIKTGNIENLTPVPKTPYIAWTHDGTKYQPYSVEKALTLFAEDEVGSPQIEVTSLYLSHPEFFRGRGIDAAGSRHGGSRVPYLYTFHGRPGVRAGRVGNPDSLWGALSRGNEIVVLGPQNS